MRPQLFAVLCTSLICTTITLSSQLPIPATLTTNNIKATVRTNGILFNDLGKGQFIAPYTPGQPELSLMRTAGLWLTGQDPAGNLKGAIHLYKLGLDADFRPGTLNEIGIPDSQVLKNVYRVTKTEIDAHIADFADNGLIDNPQPGVFGWPGRGNVHFEQYYPGQKLPFLQQGLAGFFDADFNGIYAPEAGEFPVIGGNCPNVIPSEQLWFAFHDFTPHGESKMSVIQMEVQYEVFTFNCLEENLLRNAIFIRYKLIHRATERLDDLYVGLFNDLDIGYPNDDFFGSDPSRSLVFGYNGDAFDEFYGIDNIPALGVKVLRRPLDSFGMEVPLKHVMPVEPAQLSQPIHYHHVSRGRYPDGAPAPNNGLFYPGSPNNPAADSELSAGNTPGQRRVVATYGPLTFLPGTANDLFVCYFFTQQPGLTPRQTVELMYAQADTLQAYFDNCFSGINCTPVVTASEPVTAPTLKVYPNPARNSIWVDSETADLVYLRIFDLVGREVYSTFTAHPQDQLTISVEGLAPGIYLAKIGLKEQRAEIRKVVVAK